MASGVRINRVSGNGVQKVVLAGRITEDADLSEARPTQAGRLILDLGDVKGINSCGVREWVRFVEQLPKQVEFFYERYPAPMAAQANMIARFLGRGRVLSVLAPYFCDKCHKGVDVLLQVGKDVQPGGGVPQRACPTCNSALTFDDVEGFFDFLKQ